MRSFLVKLFRSSSSMDNNSNLFESFSKAADDLFMEHLKESKLFSLLNTEEKENLDAIRRTAPQNIVPFLANIKEAKPDFFKVNRTKKSINPHPH